MYVYTKNEQKIQRPTAMVPFEILQDSPSI